MRAAVLAAGVVLAAAAIAPASVAARRIRIAHTNDMHARYTPINRFDSACDDEDDAAAECFGGMARVKTALDASGADIKIHAGDWMSGSVYDTVFGVDIAIPFYQQLGFDLVTLGNHEFDAGTAPLYRTMTALANSTSTDVVISNVHLRGAPPSAVFFQHRVRKGICWVGLLTEDTSTISSPGPNVTFANATAAAMRSIGYCYNRAQVGVISHLGVARDRQLCQDVPEVDLIVGGHSHTDMSDSYPETITRADGSTCIVAQARSFTKFMGVMDIDFDASGRISLLNATYLRLDANVSRDAATDALLEPFTTRLDARIKATVGTASAPVNGSRNACRTGECEMGNLVCAALLAENVASGAQACLINGGGLRASFMGGPISLEAVLTALPFANVDVVLDLPGRALKAAIEHGLGALGAASGTGRFPQIGGGLRVEADADAPVGSRLVGATFDGEPLGDDTLYRVVTNDFMFNGGDGYTQLEESGVNVEDSGILLSDALTNFLRVPANNPYTPVKDGRITYV